LRRYFLDRWLTVDSRTLGVFRIYFGLLLLSNLWDRTNGFNLISFYTNDGVLPNHWALFRPPAAGYWSPMLGFSTAGEVRLIVGLMALVYFLYTIGWKTRWMQVLALLCYESINLRFLLIQHGGNVVMNIVLVWTVFLPLGDRFSVDSVLRSLRAQQEDTPEALNGRGWMASLPKQYVGLAFFGVCCNFAAIYFFNTVHKGGPSWLAGTAVHYVLWQNRMATSLAELVRLHEPFFFSPMLTWGTLLIEGTMPLLILSPWAQRKLRTLGFLNCWSLHGGIAALNTLGPFSYSMMGFGTLLIQGADFDFLSKRFKRPGLKRTVRVDLGNPLHRIGARVLARMDLLEHLTFTHGEKLEVVTAAGKTTTGLDAWGQAVVALPAGWLWSWIFSVPFFADLVRSLFRLIGRWYVENEPHGTLAPDEGPLHRRRRQIVQLALPVLLGLAVLSQLSMENWAVPSFLKLRSRPDLLTNIIDYGQIPQGWSMFAPDVPRDDSRMVIDATLADGTHLDPLTGQPPDFEAPLHGPYFMNQHWCEMHSRMRNWPQHWRNFKDYLFRLPRLQGWPPGKELVAVEVWQVSANVPEPGTLTFTDLRKQKLFDQNIQ
jgi:hypothetical protein